MRTKISRVTQREQIWIDALMRSELVKDEELFTVKEAVHAVSQTPLKSGRKPLLIPNRDKLSRVLGKSEEFEKSEFKGRNKTNLWRLAQ